MNLPLAKYSLISNSLVDFTEAFWFLEDTLLLPRILESTILRVRLDLGMILLLIKLSEEGELGDLIDSLEEDCLEFTEEVVEGRERDNGERRADEEEDWDLDRGGLDEDDLVIEDCGLLDNVDALIVDFDVDDDKRDVDAGVLVLSEGEFLGDDNDMDDDDDDDVSFDDLAVVLIDLVDDDDDSAGLEFII